jgi:hypothetical protein
MATGLLYNTRVAAANRLNEDDIVTDEKSERET